MADESDAVLAEIDALDQQLKTLGLEPLTQREACIYAHQAAAFAVLASAVEALRERLRPPPDRTTGLIPQRAGVLRP